MAQKILMLTYDNYDDSEVLYPYYRLIEEGYEVDIASVEKRELHGKYHFTIMATKLVDEVKVCDYAGLVLPGGTAPEKLRQFEGTVPLVKAFCDAGLPVASICHGQQLLFSAGALRGVKCTCYPGIKDDLINAGGLYEDKCVVVDKGFVTSRRPQDLPHFMREYIKLLQK